MNPALTSPLMAGVALSAAFVIGVCVLATAFILMRHARQWGVRWWSVFPVALVGIVHLWRAAMIAHDATVTVGGLVTLLTVALGSVVVLSTLCIRILRRHDDLRTG